MPLPSSAGFDLPARWAPPGALLQMPVWNDARARSWRRGLGLAAAASWMAWRGENQTLAAARLSRWADEAGRVGNAWGDGRTAAAAAGLLLGAGTMLERPALRGAGRDLAWSFLLAGLSADLLKVAVRRRRPDGGPHSFPSGHMATAFSMAPVIARHFGPVPGALAWGLAASTAVGRIQSNRHYVSDTIFGAALGIVSAKIVLGESIPWLDRAELALTPTGLVLAIGF